MGTMTSVCLVASREVAVARQHFKDFVSSEITAGQWPEEEQCSTEMPCTKFWRELPVRITSGEGCRR